MTRLNYVRSLLVSALLAVMALVVLALVGTGQAQGAKVEPVKVEQVTVRGTAENLEVEIRTSGRPVSPNTQVITGPDRIVVDFPGALPSSTLRALKVHNGPLKGVRSGLFFENPPITRVVLDLAQARAYRIVTENNVTVIKLGAVNAGGNGLSARSATAAEGAETRAERRSEGQDEVHGDVRADVPTDVRRAALVGPSDATPGRVGTMKPVAIVAASSAPSIVTGPRPVNAVITPEARAASVNSAQEISPARPNVNVSYENGMLRIHSDKASLSQVLFEVHLKTQADIPIPSGAEQEKVVADLGPGSARDVLSALLNGSPYNFIFVGNENSLERVILTRRDPGSF